MDNNMSEGFDIFNAGFVPQQNNQEQPIQGIRIPKVQQSNQQQVINTELNEVKPVTNNTNTIASPEDMFNQLTNVKEYYTDAEWKQRFIMYHTLASNIDVDPLNLNASVIMVCASKIDALLNPVRFDYAMAQQLDGHYEMLLKLKKELEYSNIIEQCKKNNEKEPSIDNKKAMATKAIDANHSYEDGMNLFELYDRYHQRFNTIKVILDMLQSKKDTLITYSASLKIETSISNFTPSVPTNNQFEQMKG